MPHRTRQQIIRILEQRESASAYEFSKLLKVTPSNIRHHLSILIEQGSVKIAGYTMHQTRGRPSTIYALAQPLLKDNLDRLSDILLKKILDELPHDSHVQALRWLAQQLIAEFPQTANNPTQRLYLAVQTLNKLNYRAQWEAHADTPRIMFGHCPYLAILDGHPDMCQIDIFLLEYLVGKPTELIIKRSLDPDGHKQCIFRLINK